MAWEDFADFDGFDHADLIDMADNTDWVMADGTEIEITKMKKSHVINTLNMIEREGMYYVGGIRIQNLEAHVKSLGARKSGQRWIE